MNQSVSPVWPASGIAIGALLSGGGRLWPAVFAGAFLANFTTTGDWLSTAFISCGNTLEALIGYWVFQKVRRHRLRLEHQADTFAVVAASMSGPLVSASIGATALVWLNGAPSSQFLAILMTWWVGDCVGALAVVPLFMRPFRTPALKRLSFSRAGAEGVFLFAIGLAVVALVFTGFVPTVGLFLIFPVLLLIQARLGELAARGFVLMIAAMAVIFTSVKMGPFTGGLVNDGLLQLQLLIAMAAISSLVLAGFDSVGSLRVSWPALLCGWLCAAVVFLFFDRAAEQQDATHFDQLVREAEVEIKSRMKGYEDSLLAGVGLFSASAFVGNDEWQRLVDTLKIGENYPGINGVGVILPTRRSREEEFVRAAVERRRLPSLPLHDVPGGDVAGRFVDRFIITYIEPYEMNWQACGLDVGSESNRRRAAELSRDTGRPAMTDKIYLIQDQIKRPGFLVFYPFYKTKNVPPSTQERRAAFEGWVYAPFITEKALAALPNVNGDELRFEIFDHAETSDEHLIYSSEGALKRMQKFEKVTTTHILQNAFYIQWAKAARFQTARGSFLTWIMSLGLLVSLLIASMVVGLDRINRRANQIASEKTALFERAKLEAEQAARVKAEFLANMSHEIRTPMNGIIGMTNVLRNTSLTMDQKKIMDVVLSSCETLLAIVNDILDFSKLEAGKVPVEMLEFDVLEVINETAELLRPHAMAKNLELRVEVAPGAVTGIKTDATRYRQILTNLLSNAIKFTSQGGVTARLETEVQREGALVVHTSVTDSGIGIPEAALSRLFQSFSQVDVSTTRRFGGTGLGLAICKGLSELLGGRIWVESAEGKGSTFHFTVKAAPAVARRTAPATAPATIEAAPDRATGAESGHETLSKRIPLTILVADDNQVNQMVAKRFLEMLGYSADIAANGLEVLIACKQKKYDLVFMDCHMPEMDGFEATRRLIERSEGRDRPRIVALTASAMDEDRRKCREAGMDDFVVKPVSVAEIVRAIRGGFADDPRLSAPDAAAQAPASAGENPGLIDHARLLNGFVDDRELIAKVAEQFLNDLPAMLEAVETAVRRRGARALEESAHKLQGAISNFYADSVVEAACVLETRGHNGAFDGAQDDVTKLKSSMDELRRELCAGYLGAAHRPKAG